MPPPPPLQEPIAALADIASTPSDTKKQKLFHVGEGQNPSDAQSESSVDGIVENGGEHTNGRNGIDSGFAVDGEQRPEQAEFELGLEQKMDVDPVSPPPTIDEHHQPAEETARAPEVHVRNGNATSENAIAGPSTSPILVPSYNDADGNAGQSDETLLNGNGDFSPTVAAIPLAERPQANEEWFQLTMQWCGRTYPLNVAGNDMVYDFRMMIENLTQVPRDTQKLIGLLPKTKGKLGTEYDATRFGSLGVKKGIKFILIGTPEADRFKDRSPGEGGVTDDFDVTYSAQSEQKDQVMSQADDPRNKRKVKEIIDQIPITVMNEPREGKRLLVLDLDYTIVDTKPLISGALPSSECARPGLHEFLEQVYPHYDIVVWSQTHWRWLEAKLVELGIIGGTRNYRVSFVSDRTTMFPVFTRRNGQPYKHEVKPLAYFWASFPQWSAKNTVHIDDLARNFALNPGEGLRIRAFNKAGQAEGFADRELWRLGSYSKKILIRVDHNQLHSQLVNIATTVEDFTTIDHSKWKKSAPKR